MKKLFIPCALLFLTVSYGQSRINRDALQKISNDSKAKYQEALEIENTRFAGHPSDEGVAIQEIVNNTPVYYSSDSRTQARSMNVDYLSDGSLPEVEANGEGMTVYIWDGGKVRLTHQEFSGRVTQVENTGSNSDHATGVSGVIIAEGVNASAIGMAPVANLRALNFTNGSTMDEISDQSGLPENNNYMVSNHSYGALTGWYFKSSESMWYWYGYPNISETESALFGFYTSTDQTLDDIAYNAPQHSIFRSAGNNRGEGPGATVDHYAFAPNGTWQFFTGVFRPNDCTATGGYDCLAFSGSVAKNTINVAAIKSIAGNNRYSGPESVVMTSFSSWGPTDDGRIKPEVSAIGENVKSATNASDTSYTDWTGTSFSSPAAAGVGLLLQEVQYEFDGTFLRSDMMKALLVNSANEAGSDLGPDYKFGFGLIDAFQAAKTILNTDENFFTGNIDLNQGEPYTLSLKATGGEPIKATIAWLDPAGNPLPNVVLNDRTPMLVNDLDLRVTSGSDTYFPWKLDPENPSAAATQADNVVDPLEQVYIENPVAGQTYTFQVNHKGTLANNHQNFALVISGVDSSDLGVIEQDLSQFVHVYPNPVVENLNINTNQKLTDVSIKIFSPMGNMLYNKNFDSLKNPEKINMSSYPAGVYMVYIKSKEGTITKKIIKK